MLRGHFLSGTTSHGGADRPPRDRGDDGDDGDDGGGGDDDGGGATHLQDRIH